MSAFIIQKPLQLHVSWIFQILNISMISPSSLVYYVKIFLLVLNFRTSYINIALDIGLIDEVNDEIQALEKKLDVYKSQVLSDKERPPSTAQTLSPATLKGESVLLRNNFKSMCACRPVKVYQYCLHVS